MTLFFEIIFFMFQLFSIIFYDLLVMLAMPV